MLSLTVESCIKALKTLNLSSIFVFQMKMESLTKQINMTISVYKRQKYLDKTLLKFYPIFVIPLMVSLSKKQVNNFEKKTKLYLQTHLIINR